jgi:outer membrane lipoprotein-sorting protein
MWLSLFSCPKENIMLLSTRAVAVLLAALLTATNTAAAQSVDEIVAKNLKAKGGVERLKAMKTVKITGIVVTQGIELLMTTWAKRPNLVRREMQLPASGPGPGQEKEKQEKKDGPKLVNAFDGTTVWMINPMAGTEQAAEVTGPQADMTREDADFDGLLMDYKAKGRTVELVGAETIEGKNVHHLKITKKNGQVHHYFLDADTGLEMRTVTTVEQAGMKAEVTTDLSNYQQIDGLTMPFSMKQSMDGNPVAQVTIQKVEVNIPIEESIFKMPGKK